jgi:hypothetical protein
LARIARRDRRLGVQCIEVGDDRGRIAQREIAVLERRDFTERTRREELFGRAGRIAQHRIDLDALLGGNQVNLADERRERETEDFHHTLQLSRLL